MGRGQRLRKLPFKELKELGAEPIEHLVVESRPATIAIIVLPLPASGGVQVFVQGFLKARLLGKHVGLDGFYKYPDETIAPMSDQDFWDFD